MSKFETASDKATWNRTSVFLFCDACIKVIDSGHCPGTHFNRTGWDSLVNIFNKETGREYAKTQLKNKWDGLKTDWKLWKQLKEKETGLGWDVQKKTIDAPNDWWHSKLKDFPKARKFRKEGIDPELEEKLDRMFKSITATGKHAYAPSSGVLPCDDTSVQNDDNTISLEGNDDSDECTQNTSIGDKRSRTKSEQSDILTRKLKKVGGKVRGAIKLSQQIDRLVTSVESRSASLPGTSIFEVMDMVESLPGLEMGDHLWMFATRLFLNQGKREMFARMKNPEIMVKWLCHELSLGLPS